MTLLCRPITSCRQCLACLRRPIFTKHPELLWSYRSYRDSSSWQSSWKKCFSILALRSRSHDSSFSFRDEDVILLSKARSHGIVSLEQLLEESQVGHTERIGSKLADSPHHRHNLHFWLVLLEAQQSRHGIDGTKAVWRGMKYRGKQVKLPTHDPCADVLWSEFLSAGIQDPKFLLKICKDCMKGDFDRPNLFVEVVGGILQSDNSEWATFFCELLQQPWFRGRRDIVALLHSACLSMGKDAMEHFCDVIRALPDIKIYGDLTQYFWERDRPADAFAIHSFLLSRGDYPASFEILQPFVRYLAQHETNISQFVRSLDAVNVSFGSQIRRLYSLERSRVTGMSPESLNIVASRTMGIAPRKLSDDFIARAFATKAFSFDFVLNSLSLLGLIEVGPLSVRQMIIDTTELSTVRRNFAKLKELEIDTGSSAFVRVVKMVSETGPMSLLEAVAKTDLHHEVFEDLSLQRKLLTEFCHQKDWPQVNRTVAILNSGTINLTTREQSSNQVLRAMLNVRDYDGILEVLANMRRQNQKLGRSMAIYFLNKLCPHGRSPFKDGEITFDAVGFLVGIWQEAMASGSHIHSTLWREPLKNLGLQGRLDELEALIFWLAEWYRVDGINARVLEKPLFGKDASLERLFDKKIQEALISLSFINIDWLDIGFTTPKKQSLSNEPWLWGAKILKRLRDIYGLEIQTVAVRDVYSHRLRQLFNKNRISRLRRNRVAQARNKVALDEYLDSFRDLGILRANSPTSSPATFQDNITLDLKSADSVVIEHDNPVADIFCKVNNQTMKFL